MNPIFSRRSSVSALSPSVDVLTPSIVTVPVVGLSSPARMCISVDLPDPEAPITAVKLPLAKSIDTSRSASTAASPSPYRRVISWAETTASSLSLGARSRGSRSVFTRLVPLFQEVHPPHATADQHRPATLCDAAIACRL